MSFENEKSEKKKLTQCHIVEDKSSFCALFTMWCSDFCNDLGENCELILKSC